MLQGKVAGGETFSVMVMHARRLKSRPELETVTK